MSSSRRKKRKIIKKNLEQVKDINKKVKQSSEVIQKAVDNINDANKRVSFKDDFKIFFENYRSNVVQKTYSNLDIGPVIKWIKNVYEIDRYALLRKKATEIAKSSAKGRIAFEQETINEIKNIRENVIEAVSRMSFLREAEKEKIKRIKYGFIVDVFDNSYKISANIVRMREKIDQKANIYKTLHEEAYEQLSTSFKEFVEEKEKFIEIREIFNLLKDEEIEGKIGGDLYSFIYSVLMSGYKRRKEVVSKKSSELYLSILSAFKGKTRGYFNFAVRKKIKLSPLTFSILKSEYEKTKMNLIEKKKLMRVFINRLSDEYIDYQASRISKKISGRIYSNLFNIVSSIGYKITDTSIDILENIILFKDIKVEGVQFDHVKSSIKDEIKKYINDILIEKCKSLLWDSVGNVTFNVANIYDMINGNIKQLIFKTFMDGIQNLDESTKENLSNEFKNILTYSIKNIFINISNNIGNFKRYDENFLNSILDGFDIGTKIESKLLSRINNLAAKYLFVNYENVHLKDNFFDLITVSYKENKKPVFNFVKLQRFVQNNKVKVFRTSLEGKPIMYTEEISKKELISETELRNRIVDKLVNIIVGRTNIKNPEVSKELKIAYKSMIAEKLSESVENKRDESIKAAKEIILNIYSKNAEEINKLEKYIEGKYEFLYNILQSFSDNELTRCIIGSLIESGELLNIIKEQELKFTGLSIKKVFRENFLFNIPPDQLTINEVQKVLNEKLSGTIPSTDLFLNFSLNTAKLVDHIVKKSEGIIKVIDFYTRDTETGIPELVIKLSKESGSKRPFELNIPIPYKYMTSRGQVPKYYPDITLFDMIRDFLTSERLTDKIISAVESGESQDIESTENFIKNRMMGYFSEYFDFNKFAGKNVLNTVYFSILRLLNRPSNTFRESDFMYDMFSEGLRALNQIFRITDNPNSSIFSIIDIEGIPKKIPTGTVDQKFKGYPYQVAGIFLKGESIDFMDTYLDIFTLTNNEINEKNFGDLIKKIGLLGHGTDVESKLNIIKEKIRSGKTSWAEALNEITKNTSANVIFSFSPGAFDEFSLVRLLKQADEFRRFNIFDLRAGLITFYSLFPQFLTREHNLDGKNIVINNPILNILTTGTGGSAEVWGLYYYGSKEKMEEAIRAYIDKHNELKEQIEKGGRHTALYDTVLEKLLLDNLIKDIEAVKKEYQDANILRSYIEPVVNSLVNSQQGGNLSDFAATALGVMYKISDPILQVTKNAAKNMTAIVAKSLTDAYKDFSPFAILNAGSEMFREVSPILSEFVFLTKKAQALGYEVKEHVVNKGQNVVGRIVEMSKRGNKKETVKEFSRIYHLFNSHTPYSRTGKEQVIDNFNRFILVKAIATTGGVFDEGAAMMRPELMQMLGHTSAKSTQNVIEAETIIKIGQNSISTGLYLPTGDEDKTLEFEYFVKDRSASRLIESKVNKVFKKRENELTKLKQEIDNIMKKLESASETEAVELRKQLENTEIEIEKVISSVTEELREEFKDFFITEYTKEELFDIKRKNANIIKNPRMYLLNDISVKYSNDLNQVFVYHKINPVYDVRPGLKVLGALAKAIVIGKYDYGELISISNENIDAVINLGGVFKKDQLGSLYTFIAQGIALEKYNANIIKYITEGKTDRTVIDELKEMFPDLDKDLETLINAKVKNTLNEENYNEIKNKIGRTIREEALKVNTIGKWEEKDVNNLRGMSITMNGKKIEGKDIEEHLLSIYKSLGIADESQTRLVGLPKIISLRKQFDQYYIAVLGAEMFSVTRLDEMYLRHMLNLRDIIAGRGIKISMMREPFSFMWGAPVNEDVIKHFYRTAVSYADIFGKGAELLYTWADIGGIENIKNALENNRNLNVVPTTIKDVAKDIKDAIDNKIFVTATGGKLVNDPQGGSFSNVFLNATRISQYLKPENETEIPRWINTFIKSKGINPELLYIDISNVDVTLGNIGKDMKIKLGIKEGEKVEKMNARELIKRLTGKDVQRIYIPRVSPYLIAFNAEEQSVMNLPTTTTTALNIIYLLNEGIKESNFDILKNNLIDYFNYIDSAFRNNKAEGILALKSLLPGLQTVANSSTDVPFRTVMLSNRDWNEFIESVAKARDPQRWEKIKQSISKKGEIFIPLLGQPNVGGLVPVRVVLSNESENQSTKVSLDILKLIYRDLDQDLIYMISSVSGDLEEGLRESYYSSVVDYIKAKQIFKEKIKEKQFNNINEIYNIFGEGGISFSTARAIIRRTGEGNVTLVFPTINEFSAELKSRLQKAGISENVLEDFKNYDEYVVYGLNVSDSFKDIVKNAFENLKKSDFTIQGLFKKVMDLNKISKVDTAYMRKLQLLDLIGPSVLKDVGITDKELVSKILTDAYHALYSLKEYVGIKTTARQNKEADLTVEQLIHGLSNRPEEAKKIIGVMKGMLQSFKYKYKAPEGEKELSAAELTDLLMHKVLIEHRDADEITASLTRAKTFLLYPTTPEMLITNPFFEKIVATLGGAKSDVALKSIIEASDDYYTRIIERGSTSSFMTDFASFINKTAKNIGFDKVAISFANFSKNFGESVAKNKGTFKTLGVLGGIAFGTVGIMSQLNRHRFMVGDQDFSGWEMDVPYGENLTSPRYIPYGKKRIRLQRNISTFDNYYRYKKYQMALKYGNVIGNVDDYDKYMTSVPYPVTFKNIF